jgi:hypothetical protein
MSGATINKNDDRVIKLNASWREEGNLMMWPILSVDGNYWGYFVDATAYAAALSLRCLNG